MRSIALFLVGVIFLDQCGVQGNLVIRNQRCSCIRTAKGMIPSYRSLRDLKQFAPSPQCNKTEIIIVKLFGEKAHWCFFSSATLKTGTQTCLNPDSANVKKLMDYWEKQISLKKNQKRGKKHQKNKKARKARKPQGPRSKAP